MTRLLRGGATACLLAGSVAAAGPTGDAPVVGVVDLGRGAFRVVAEFDVAHPAAAVRDVLTDYERIPRFMPEVRTSRLRFRAGSIAVVEQELAARFFLFSTTLHLRLEVHEEHNVISFRDLAGRSFARYEGRWELTEIDGVTRVRYELLAEPAFDVPAFLFRRALRGNAARMVERLRAEVACRLIEPD